MSSTLPRLPRAQPLGRQPSPARLPHARPVPAAAAAKPVIAAAPEAAPRPGSQTRAPTAADVAVGLRIRALRRAAGHTQKELARHVGVTNAQLHRYEAGISRVAASRLVAIAKALNCRVADLVSDDAPEEAERPAPHDEEFARLARAFAAISDPKHRAALVSLAHTMAGAANDERQGAD